MTALERAARALCAANRDDPDKLEPGNCPYSDETVIIDGKCANGDPGFFVWRLYVDDARAVLAAIREPSGRHLEAGGELLFAGSRAAADQKATEVWQVMIDAVIAQA